MLTIKLKNEEIEHILYRLGNLCRPEIERQICAKIRRTRTLKKKKEKMFTKIVVEI